MVIPSVLSCLWCEVDDGINNLTLFFAFIVSKNPIMLSQNPESKIWNKTRMKRLSMKRELWLTFWLEITFCLEITKLNTKKIEFAKCDPTIGRPQCIIDREHVRSAVL